jgi:two-component system response regulator FixJ
MPGSDGLSVLESLRKIDGAAPVLVITGHGDIALAVSAMKLGAHDFMEKPYSPADLLTAIEATRKSRARQKDVALENAEARKLVGTLSERQRAVLLGILKGQANKIIAYELGLSIRTVEAYRAQMLIKLGVRGTAEAVRLAIAAGLDSDPTRALPPD